MKNVFAMTRNVELMVSLVNSLTQRNRGVDGMGLVYGEPGLGKTRTAIWLSDKINAAYYRAKEHTTLRSLLEGLVVELGQAPAYRTSDLYTQAVEVLRETGRAVMVDEIDYLAGAGRGLQTLRDLADETGVAIILIGMMDAERKIARFRHLYDRLASHVMRFRALGPEDVKRFSAQVCEVALDDSAVEEIATITGGRIRRIINELYKAERIARANDLDLVKAQHLKVRKAA